jgi:Family of unknown function (DUF6065)
MAYNVDVYVENENNPSAIIKPLSIERSWMEPNIYHCTPLALLNKFGWGISFPEDISFIWDGDDNNPAEVIKGKEYCNPVRTYGTISMHTNYIFRTSSDVSLLTMPVPNEINKDAMCLTTGISSSFFTGSLNIVWKATSINKEILIPANTNVASIMPISLKQFDNSTLTIKKGERGFKDIHNTQKYIDEMDKIHKKNKLAGFYKKGLDENYNKIGRHEVVNFRLGVVNE